METAPLTIIIRESRILLTPHYFLHVLSLSPHSLSNHLSLLFSVFFLFLFSIYCFHNRPNFPLLLTTLSPKILSFTLSYSHHSSFSLSIFVLFITSKLLSLHRAITRSTTFCSLTQTGKHFDAFDTKTFIYRS